MNPDYTLEKRISSEIVSFSGKMGVYGNDFKGCTIEIDADELFETASCIKVFILAGLFSQVCQGKKSLTDRLTYEREHFVNGSGVLQSLEPGTTLSVKNLATLMIIVSDNIATNMLIDYLGIPAINDTIRSLGLKKTELFNRLDFEKYDRLGATTPREYGKTFEWLHSGELVSAHSSAEMRSIFCQQHYNSMLIRDFPQKYIDEERTGDPNLIRTASKSGSMDACRNDGGIVMTPYGEYVVALFTKDFHDPLYYEGHESIRFGAKVSRLLLDQYLALEGRFTLPGTV